MARVKGGLLVRGIFSRIQATPRAISTVDPASLRPEITSSKDKLPHGEAFTSGGPHARAFHECVGSRQLASDFAQGPAGWKKATAGRECCASGAGWQPNGRALGGAAAAASAAVGGARHFHSTGTREMAKRDFYSVLGVGKGADGKEIKKAYYELAKKLHPDANKGDPKAEEKFQEIQEAYEVLKDDEKRAMYDQVGPEAFEQHTNGGGGGGEGNARAYGFGGGFGRGGGFSSEDIFGNMHGMGFEY
eukprot:jgi/Mesen1/6717/ME000344S06001